MSNANTARPHPPTTAGRHQVTAEMRSRALQVAARAGCDARTALRAILEGPETIRVLTVRENVERAMLELGVAAERP